MEKMLAKSPAHKGVLLRTASDYEVALVAPEHLRELQCAVCHKLIQNAVHAPCGHSFCQDSREDRGIAQALVIVCSSVYPIAISI